MNKKQAVFMIRRAIEGISETEKYLFSNGLLGELAEEEMATTKTQLYNVIDYINEREEK